jgi:hypothetical protein
MSIALMKELKRAAASLCKGCGRNPCTCKVGKRFRKNQPRRAKVRPPKQS